MDVEKTAIQNDVAGNSTASDDGDSSPPPNAVWPIKDSEGYVVVPFTYGSVALWQGKRAPEFQTFRWYFLSLIIQIPSDAINLLTFVSRQSEEHLASAGMYSCAAQTTRIYPRSSTGSCSSSTRPSTIPPAYSTRRVESLCTSHPIFFTNEQQACTLFHPGTVPRFRAGLGRVRNRDSHPSARGAGAGAAARPRPQTAPFSSRSHLLSSRPLADK